MPESDDIHLLREFAERRSDAAFGELVRRHVNLVYSVAHRQTGNPHAAEEITQAVFIIFARKAGSLGPKTILSGWLYQTARLTAANFLRTERRRASREQEAYMQSLSNEPGPEVWRQIAPLLDDAMAKLGDQDRDAVLLRFFEGKSLGEIGAALGTSEDAAKMRVNRALEKLRRIFSQRGVTLTVALVAGAVSANSVQAAPLGLAATAAAVTAQGAAISESITILVKGTMKLTAWMKLKFAAGCGLTALLVGGLATIAFSGGSANPNNQSAQTAEPMLIVPGESVGKVLKGMTTNEVEAVLGKPAKWQGRIMVYDQKLGMSVSQGKAGVMVVFCGDSMLGYPGVKKFKGRTKEGIGMESSRADVIAAFGQPTTAQPWNTGQEQLEYKALGLTFTLEAGKVINIIVDFRPADASAARPPKR